MREFLIVRHGIALNRLIAAEQHVRDERRELIEKGRQRMQQIARGLRHTIDSPQVILTSPLLRAAQTADILAQAFGQVPVHETDALAPGALPEQLLAQSLGYRDGGVIALVGHEPGLSEWVGWLLTGSPRSLMVLKKGGACLVDFPDHGRAGEGVLRWHMAPRQMRMLAKC